MNFITKHAKIAVIIAVICGACSGSFSALTAIPAIGIGFWRLTLVLPFFLIPVLTSPEKKKLLKEVSRTDLLWCGLSGLFLFIHYFSWFNAVKMTNVASAAVLASFHPLAVLAENGFHVEADGARLELDWENMSVHVALNQEQTQAGMLYRGTIGVEHQGENLLVWPVAHYIRK